jgi:hypothetical protein
MEKKSDNRGQAYLEGGLDNGVEISNHRGGRKPSDMCEPLIYTDLASENKAIFTFHIWTSPSS